MKVLVIGQGGREHAIVWKLSQSPKVDKIYCAPGNGGIAELAQLVPISAMDFSGLAQFVKDEGIDLTVVGPEDPLTDGIVDFFEERQLQIFGPAKSAAIIEGSKAFTKELMKKYNIPTAEYASFDHYEEALAYVREKGAPIVVKADGLAAGKGVTVASTLEEAEKALQYIMVDQGFGEAGARVVIEECLAGQEMSILAFVDGETVKPMVPSQDHKPVFDGDKGPNTGGMGTYSPVPQIDDAIVEKAIAEILNPVARAMVQEGRPFRGILYAGLMVTDQGPKVIEFNARFGDPETQVVLPRLETDLLDIFLATVQGELENVEIKWKPEAALCVIMASGGYPGSYEKGKEIRGLKQLESDENIMVFHAGTKQEGDKVLTSGGRVLGVTALAPDLEEAQRKAYEAVEKIKFDGAHYRTDIGSRAIQSR
ncbi:MAG: phosphoribosylamine--glycine ligase [Bacillaceae bacterium]|nr:phosphoribosylamine--glycine ligase [Bacillaceae bacterium]